MRTIILFSGGRESLINLYREQREHEDILLVLINYGQKAFKHELASTRYYADLFGVPYEVLSMKLLFPDGYKEGKSTHIINRNLLLLSYVVNRYHDKNIPLKILLGIVNQYGEYNDGSADFLRDIQPVFKKMYPNLLVDSHSKKFSNFTSIDWVIKNCDTTHIWMCDNNHKKMCGTCIKCKDTLKMFKEKSKYWKQIEDKYEQV